MAFAATIIRSNQERSCCGMPTSGTFGGSETPQPGMLGQSWWAQPRDTSRSSERRYLTAACRDNLSDVGHLGPETMPRRRAGGTGNHVRRLSGNAQTTACTRILHGLQNAAGPPVGDSEA